MRGDVLGKTEVLAHRAARGGRIVVDPAAEANGRREQLLDRIRMLLGEIAPHHERAQPRIRHQLGRVDQRARPVFKLRDGVDWRRRKDNVDQPLA